VDALLTFAGMRLAGFKSFVEPTELPIEPGLTGIVGPNGCGKSNLVEALRWVMGETSARQLRGGEMDDVIFTGTAGRPGRNVAEVTVELDNSSGTAPPPFDRFERLQVSRRIERARGSEYRINGSESRARDVQLLFADAATGARSSALISQGEVGALIAAKPKERRILIEEAAGIIGLHSRRHEADLRLRAAEANLERVEDVLTALSTQLDGLKRQARQAARYRAVAAQIRETEALLYALRWQAADAARSAANQRLALAEATVRERTAAAGAAAARQAEAVAKLPELRRYAGETAKDFQRIRLEMDALHEEERRTAEDLVACRTRLQETLADGAREATIFGEANAALAQLDEERRHILAQGEGEQETRAEAEAALALASAEVTRIDCRVTELVAVIAASEAGRAALAQSLRSSEERRRRLACRREEIGTERRRLERELIGLTSEASAEGAVADAESALDRARGELHASEQVSGEHRAEVAAAAAKLQTAEALLDRLQSEESLLVSLTADGCGGVTPLLDAVSTSPGMEQALAAALGDDVFAPVDEQAPAFWRTLPPLAVSPPWPEDVRPFAGEVAGPAALARTLSLVGVVDDAADGERLQPQLQPGQRLVARDGSLWRWDGYSVSAAALASGQRLQQRARLDEIRTRLPAARSAVDQGAALLAAAETGVAQSREAEQRCRSLVHAAERKLACALYAGAEATQRLAQTTSRSAALAEALAAIEIELAEADAGIAALAKELGGLAEPTAARERLHALRDELNAARAVETRSKAAAEAEHREAEARVRRLASIEREVAAWTARREAAEQQRQVLADRAHSLEARQGELAARPQHLERKRQELLRRGEAAEAEWIAATDRLAHADRELAEADRAARLAESALAATREDRIRAEAEVAQADASCRIVADRIGEALGMAPDRLVETAGFSDTAPVPGAEEVERRLERLRRDREMIGPVNLRAEQEVSAVGNQIDTLASERDDLVRAIMKLRRGIAELDREGRERLLASFAEVDRHFRELFVRLFGGGRAHLALTDADDPLEAGIEILASPPGKRLQLLSLLSGGEQALATLALVFAVFLSNPTPICVLDEVDAPLDDANVDRFCSLLEWLGAGGRTRFLVITHHRMTMARMDRLFGVTMAERGVSQLVSVDLQQAESLRVTA
jgi:chromosome segregation protein